MFADFLIRSLFKLEDEIVVMLGTTIQPGSFFVPIKTRQLWKRENTTTKFKAILSLKWKPSEDLLSIASKSIFMDDMFGLTADYGENLYRLIKWHNSREWNIKELTEHDNRKAEAIESMTLLTRLRYEQTSDVLHLKLFERAPFMCFLTLPMIVKIPVVSMQYFINIHSHFAFNSIRKAKHPQADSLIDYIYEVLYLQQKTAIAIHEFLIRLDYAQKNKNEALLMNAEINAIMSADLIFSYLKACIEKTMVIVALTHGITNLDSKKTHQSKLTALNDGLPKKLFDLDYFQFMFNFFSSENLDELNNYRSGILHKKGIADLQPHHYLDKRVESLPLLKIFNVIFEQHCKNAATLIGAFAILTDKLVELDRPQIQIEDLPF